MPLITVEPREQDVPDGYPTELPKQGKHNAVVVVVAPCGCTVMASFQPQKTDRETVLEYIARGCSVKWQASAIIGGCSMTQSGRD